MIKIGSEHLSNKNDISHMFIGAKAIAIVSVISAHIVIKNSVFLNNLYNTIGSVGVILFLIASGYYYKKYPFNILIKKKAVSICIPWIIMGTFVYIVNSYLLGTPIAISSLFLWLSGYKTYLYFVIILLACFLIFYVHNKITLLTAVILNIVSLTLTSVGIMQPIINTLHITNYLNIFNWIGFFAIGILLKSIDSDKLYSFIRSYRYILIGSSIIATIVISITGYEIGYFTMFGWVYELVCALAILSLSTYSIIYNRFAMSISELSFSIYLFHILFPGILSKIYHMNIFLAAISNILVLAVTYSLLIAGVFISSKLRLGKLYRIAIGLRAFPKYRE